MESWFENWKQESDQLFRDLDAFIKRWDKHRKCKCENPNCCHFERALNKTELKQKSIELFNENLYHSMKAFARISSKDEETKQ